MYNGVVSHKLVTVTLNSVHSAAIAWLFCMVGGGYICVIFCTYCYYCIIIIIIIII